MSKRKDTTKRQTNKKKDQKWWNKREETKTWQVSMITKTHNGWKPHSSLRRIVFFLTLIPFHRIFSANLNVSMSWDNLFNHSLGRKHDMCCSLSAWIVKVALICVHLNNPDHTNEKCCQTSQKLFVLLVDRSLTTFFFSTLQSLFSPLTWCENYGMWVGPRNSLSLFLWKVSSSRK